jgi:hypothetical protein
LAWRPSGNLIASVQRFGSSFEGGGEGREGKHDVVFFERNGLRHGEFELRETREKFEEKEEGGETRGWDYRVRDLSWNSDSTVLAVWLDRRGELGDVGKPNPIIHVRSFRGCDQSLTTFCACLSPTLDDEQLLLVSQAGNHRAFPLCYQIHLG